VRTCQRDHYLSGGLAMSYLKTQKKTFNLFFLFLLLLPSISLAIDTIKIEEKEALFTAFDNTSPIVTTKYIGWNQGKKWKWAGATISTKQSVKKQTRFTGRVTDLGIDFNGSITQHKNQLKWSYAWDKKSDISDAIGFGIEFNLILNSPSFGKAAQNPELLPNNKGWKWQTPDGKTIEVSFSPSLANLVFERKQKNKIRAFFYTGITSGTESSIMTVKVSHGVTLSATDTFNDKTSKIDIWDKDILPSITSPIDLSFLNSADSPAGKHGFVKREKDHLVFEDGVPIKFWGTNIMAYALFSSSDYDIKRHAKRIAQLGFNLVRIHHHDSAWVKPNIFTNPSDNTLELSKPALKKLDWWIKCLKEEGVYLWLDLHVGRAMTPKDSIQNFDDLAKGEKSAEIKGFNYYNESIQDAMQAFNAAYLNHINQFTKLAYKDDPAVFALLITNENDLSQHFGNKLLPNMDVPFHNALFTKDVKQFSKKQGLPYDKTWLTWEMGASKIYLNDVEHRFNTNMLQHLNQLGVKSLIATTNSWGKMGIFGLPSLTDGHIIDAHSYGRDEEFKNNPRFTPSFLSWIGAAQVSGYPLSVSEWNIEPFAARDRFTAPLYTSSIASLQGWDALMLYGYSQADLGLATKGDNYSSFNDPAMMGLMPAASLLYRQGHVSQAKKSYKLDLPKNKFFYTRYDPLSSKAIRTVMETSHFSIALPETSELPWLKEHIISDVDAISITNPDKDFIPKNQTFVESDTGELRRNWQQGIQTINTPKSQVASGWIGGNKIKLNDVTFNITTKKAVVAIQSLENKEINKSHKIFITLMAQSKPTQGKELPFLSEPVTGTLDISAPQGLKFYPINKLGRFENPIKLPYNAGRYKLLLKSASNFHWGILQP